MPQPLNRRLAMKRITSVNFEDVLQVIVGASALSVPVAFSEEAWNLGRTLPLINILFLFTLSIIFINLYSFHSIFQGDIQNRKVEYFSRTILDYSITILVVFVVLLALNHMPIISEPIVAIKRIIILSFPASMGGVVVDSFDKE
jgi:uncharacterized membrane protein